MKHNNYGFLRLFSTPRTADLFNFPVKFAWFVQLFVCTVIVFCPPMQGNMRSSFLNVQPFAVRRCWVCWILMEMVNWTPLTSTPVWSAACAFGWRKRIVRGGNRQTWSVARWRWEVQSPAERSDSRHGWFATDVGQTLPSHAPSQLNKGILSIHDKLMFPSYSTVSLLHWCQSAACTSGSPWHFPPSQMLWVEIVIGRTARYAWTLS